MKIFIHILKTVLAVGTMALLLWGCAAQIQTPTPTSQLPAQTQAQAPVGARQAEAYYAQGRDYFPGGYDSYAFGTSQSKENFENVEAAQYYFGLFTSQRSWINISIVRVFATAQIIGLYNYFPIDVRWKLKDGREFLLEKIDIRAIMREYFKTQDIQLPWQKEKRKYDVVGDGDPLLVIEVKNDAVQFKWIISTNRTPVNQRLTASGGANKWDFTSEEFIVGVVKGKPTTGIDFANWLEMRK